MATLSAAAVRDQIRRGVADTLYLLQGEDEIEKTALAQEFESLVDEGVRVFNVDRVHAGDATNAERRAAALAQLVAATRTLPMMAERRVVIVSHADPLLAPKKVAAAPSRKSEEAKLAGESEEEKPTRKSAKASGETTSDELEAFLASPEPHATVVLVAGAINKASRIWKVLTKHATIVPCGVVETLDDAVRWVERRVGETRVNGVSVAIDKDAARLLAERCGTDVPRLRNDVDRLLLYAMNEPRVTLADVRAIVGAATLQDTWAMANAIESGDARTALRTLALMIEGGEAQEMVLGQLGWLVRTKFSSRGPHVVRAAVDAVFRTDRDMKRSAGDPRILLERLVVELCTHERGRPA